MTQTSSMFLGDTTNIDYAFINERGNIVGGSIRPKFVVTGKVDPIEQVVVDFSAIKKAIKKLIDDPDRGYDHKLWVLPTSKCAVRWYDDSSTVTVSAPGVSIEGPSNILKVLDYADPATDISDYLESNLKELYPDVSITVDTVATHTFDLMPQCNSGAFSFTYVHGLKNSTSWGCQNIAHGHFSYLSAETTNVAATDTVLKAIADELQETIFAWVANLSEEEDNDAAYIDYTSNRGRMHMSIDTIAHKLVVLETETTVEHLVDYVAAKWHQELVDAGVTRLYVSEGLSKGACTQLD